MNDNRSSRLLVTLGSVIVFLLTASVSPGQQSRCSYCVFVFCGTGQGGYGCATSTGVVTICSRSEPDQDGCYQDCANKMFCPHTAAKCDPSDPRTLSVRQLQEQSDERKAVKDEDVQAELLSKGAAAAQIELQAGDPATLIGAVHGRKDMLKSAEVWNNSKKTIAAVRIGWIVKTPNQPDETAVGNWNPISPELQAGEIASIPAQNLDGAPLRTAGTIVRFYVAEVRFQDGSVWQRVSATKTEPRKTSWRSLKGWPTPSPRDPPAGAQP